MTSPQTSSPEQDGLVYDEPTDRIIYHLTTPMSYRDGRSISRRVNFLSYLTQVGKTRELAMEDISPEFHATIASGDYLLVTNWTETRVLREMRVYEKLITKLFITRVNERSCMISWEQYREGVHGPELVAVTEQDTTWTRVLSEGHIEASPMPPWLRVWLDRQLALGNHPPREILPVASHRTFPEEPRRAVAPETRFSMEMMTTTFNSNMGGNIYFLNYFEWMVSALDQYIHSIAPGFFRDLGRAGELLVTRARVDHLRDSIPFDVQRVEVGLGSVGETSAEFVVRFAYSRDGGAFLKSGVGLLDVAFVVRDGQGNPVPTPWPADLLARLAVEGHLADRNL